MRVGTAGGDSVEVTTGAAYRTGLAAVGPLAVAVAFGTAERLLSLEHSSFLAAVGGSLVAVSAATGRQVGQPIPLSDDLTGLAATPDGRNLLIIGDQSVTESRLATDGTPSRPVALPGFEWGGPLAGFPMSPDGSLLYMSVADGEDPGGLSFVRL